MRATSVPFSVLRPSRLKNEPGILPAAYMRSSTSTVSGRKSTSRRLPAVAVLRTTGVALADDDGAGGLLGHLARLEGDLGSGDLDGDTGLGSTHMKLSSCPRARPSVGAPASLLGFCIRTALIVAEVGQQPRVGHPGVPAVSEEQHRRRRRAGGAARRARRAARGPRRGTAAVGVEAREVEAEHARALPQVRVVEVPLIGIERVAELPEGALCGGGLGGVGERQRALALRPQREVAKGDAGVDARTGARAPARSADR